MKENQNELLRTKRRRRIRKKIQGTSERPRLCVKRSAKHMIAQIVDDLQARSLAQVSSCSKEIQGVVAKEKGKLELGKQIGVAIAEKALALGIKKVAFDRGGYPYHGRVKALADAARKKGLQF